MGPSTPPPPSNPPLPPAAATSNESAPRLVVAIDGPAGAGKSTVARMLAERLGYSLLDTGAIYRTLALLASRQGISWQDGSRVAALAQGLDIRFQLHDGANRVLVDGADVTADIRTPHVSDGASQVSAVPTVRQALLGLQRRLGAEGGVVVEGRDIGTVVFPDAQAKFFLTAAPEERARRRAAELRDAGTPADEKTVLAEMQARDHRDTNRAVAPLRRAEDAIEIDTSGIDAGKVVEIMLDAVRQKSAATPGISDEPWGAPKV